MKGKEEGGGEENERKGKRGVRRKKEMKKIVGRKLFQTR